MCGKLKKEGIYIILSNRSHQLAGILILNSRVRCKAPQLQ